MSVTLRANGEGLDLCEAISYDKSVGADMYVNQKCPFRY